MANIFPTGFCQDKAESGNAQKPRTFPKASGSLSVSRGTPIFQIAPGWRVPLFSSSPGHTFISQTTVLCQQPNTFFFLIKKTKRKRKKAITPWNDCKMPAQTQTHSTWMPFGSRFWAGENRNGSEVKVLLQIWGKLCTMRDSHLASGFVFLLAEGLYFFKACLWQYF